MQDPNRPVTGYPPPAAADYPYAAPPPNAYHSYPYYQQNHQPDPDAARRATCLRRFFGFLIGLVILFGLITFIFWLVLRPQLPKLRVDSLSVSNFTLVNNSLISFTSQTHLTARNPNKKLSLVYDRIDAGIFLESYSVSETPVAPFSQGTKSETPLTVNFAVAGSFVDRSTGDKLNSARTRNGLVVFNLRLLSIVRFETNVWRARRRYLKVFCGPLSVAIPVNASSGTLTGGPIQCHIGT